MCLLYTVVRRRSDARVTANQALPADVDCVGELYKEQPITHVPIGRSGTVFPHEIGRFHRDQATAADILAESETLGVFAEIAKESRSFVTDRRVSALT